MLVSRCPAAAMAFGTAWPEGEARVYFLFCKLVLIFPYCREAAMPASSPEDSWYPEARKCAARVPSNDLYVLQSSRNGNAHISKLFFAVSFDKVRT